MRRALLTGEVRAARAAKISPPATDQWMVQIKWLEKDGTPVRAGQRVVEFDSSQFSSGLEEKRLAVVSALRFEESGQRARRREGKRRRRKRARRRPRRREHEDTNRERGETGSR